MWTFINIIQISTLTSTLCAHILQMSRKDARWSAGAHTTTSNSSKRRQMAAIVISTGSSISSGRIPPTIACINARGSSATPRGRCRSARRIISTLKQECECRGIIDSHTHKLIWHWSSYVNKMSAGNLIVGKVWFRS